MGHVFNKRFQELMNDFEDKQIHVYPLTLVHISDLENLESSLRKKPYLIWQLLTANFRNPSKFIPPFYPTVSNRGIRAGYERIMKKIVKLFINKEDQPAAQD